MEDIDPDDIILNPEYARKIRQKSGTDDRDPLDTRLGRPLTDEELAEFGKQRKKQKTGITIRPMITIKEMGRKNKKPVLVPFIGIQGTF